jgi:hypothetical protein
VSDTPRMDLALRKAQEDCTESYLLTEGLKLERELNSAQERIKRLEDIISRAAYAFYRDGSDGQVASRMLTILEEVRKL